MKESHVLSAVRLAMGQRATLFRANVGQAWTGNEVIRQGRDVLIRDARPFNTGLPPGFSDLFGWTRQGDVARFLALECKGPTGRPTEDQLRFLAAVKAAGGIAGVVRSPEEALALLSL